ncbi:uncharacterized protein LOC122666088 [Telopea speciosissima]|uniref:uncharacterized protein LOC122666088 n=1 Tax=Telopea speciosissima TaxID=54955 RepID=UPI001CC5DE62|nr:uncharacterized protein LOC122666088 [Telopea speciosissima]
MKLEEIFNLKDCVDIYCKASGQAIKYKKSSMTFGPNVVGRFRRWFSRILKISYTKGPSKYLGLPMDFGISKAVLFQELADKVGRRFSGWKNHLLSHAGKEVGEVGRGKRWSKGHKERVVRSWIPAIAPRLSSIIVIVRLIMAGGEVLAIREGLLEAISEGTLSVMVESDNLTIVNYLLDPLKVPDLRVLPILDDIRHISSYLDDCTFSYVSRTANSIADCLARRALSVSGRMVWSNSDPCLSEGPVSDFRSVSRSLQ